jgi:hypothetical protein
MKNNQTIIIEEFIKKIFSKIKSFLKNPEVNNIPIKESLLYL